MQQANSIYAGVTHPRSTRGHSHDHAHAAARASAKSCPRGACATESGGPAAFSEIQETNYYGVSHFPCCITNFPQGEASKKRCPVARIQSTSARLFNGNENVVLILTAVARAGWPKFAQSAVLWQASAQAIVIASLLPLNATVAQASNASVRIATAYRLPSIVLWSPAALRTAIRYEGVPPLHAFLYLSLYLSLHLSLHLSLYLATHLTVI